MDKNLYKIYEAYSLVNESTVASINTKISAVNEIGTALILEDEIITGVDSEYNLVKIIRELSLERQGVPFNLKIGPMIVFDVVDADRVGGTTKFNRKADVHIFSKDRTITPISMKKLNADLYASFSSNKTISQISMAAIKKLRKEFGQKPQGQQNGLISKREIIKDGKYELNFKEYEITRIGIVLDDKNWSDKIIKYGMFGSDIENNGAIIFVDVFPSTQLVKNSENEFELPNVKYVIQTLEDVKRLPYTEYPILSIQNHNHKKIIDETGTEDLSGVETRLTTTKNVIGRGDMKNIVLGISELDLSHVNSSAL